MKRRSVVATMLAAAMALSLTACGSKSADTAQTTAAGTDTTAAADANTTSDWPKQTITMICGFGAGGSSDLGMVTAASFQTGWLYDRSCKYTGIIYRLSGSAAGT